MNNLHIASLNRPGALAAPVQASPNGAEQTGGGGFIDQILLPQPSASRSTTGVPAEKPVLKDLTAKIASLLKEEEKIPAALRDMTPEDLAAKIVALIQATDTPLPEQLQNISTADLTEKIAALLQQDGVAKSPDNGIQPSLIRDLVARLSTQIQNTPETQPLQPPHPPQAAADMPHENAAPTETELAEFLSQLQPGDDSDSEVAKILAQLKTQAEEPSATPDSSVLQQLKDKIAALSLNPGDINKDVLVQFKADIIQFLKDQGMDQPAIEHHLMALAKYLRQDSVPPATSAATDAPAEAPVLIGSTAAALPAPTPDTAEPAPPSKPDILSQNPRRMLISADGAPNPKSAELPDNLPLQKTAAAHAGSPADNVPARPQLPATASPAAPPTLTEKIAGVSVNPHMIRALANNDAGFFGGDSFGAGGNGQPQDLPNGAGLLKPIPADALNNQNFTNYMTSMRNLPNPVTQMVNIQLQRNINAKVDTMTLQLDPADLGRLDIRLKFSKDGSVKAHLTVDRPETLALLQKDSSHLERVLQKTGLSADENSLSFDLRQHNQQHNLEGYSHNNRDKGEFSDLFSGGAAENTLQARIAVQTAGYITSSGINIMV